MGIAFAALFTALRACLIPGAPWVWNGWATAGLAFMAGFGVAAAFLFQRLQKDFADRV